METRNEIWKDIEGWEGFYQVSNLGRVRSVDRYIYKNRKGYDRLIACHFKGKILKPGTGCGGYLFVQLCGNGNDTLARIHRLVAKAFVPGYKKDLVVNHKDENKTNNTVFLNEDGSFDSSRSNLEWVTYAENNCYGSLATRIGMAVIQMTLDGMFIHRWKSVSTASKELGIAPSMIRRVCIGKCKQTHGYRWRYADD